MKNKLPQNIAVEKEVLGAMLQFEESVLSAIQILKPEYFFDKRHQVLFKVLRDMNSAGIEIDLVTTYECLLKEKENIVEAHYLSELTESISSGATTTYLCAVITEKWVRRQGIQAAMDLATQCYNESEDTFDVMGNGIQAMEDILADVEERNDSYNFRDWLPELIDEIAKERTNPELSNVLKFMNFAKFNECTGGVGSTNLILVSGKYKRGKTTFALALGLDAAVSQKLPIGFVSLEMEKKGELGKKIISMQTGTRYSYLRNPASRGSKGHLHFSQEALQRMSTESQKQFIDTKLLISDEVMNEMQIKALMKYWVKKEGVKMVIIDYLQLIQSPRRFERQELEIAYMSRFFKLAAKDIGVPIVLIVQENEEGHLAYGKGPARDADFWFSVTKTIKEFPNRQYVETKVDDVTHKLLNDESLFMITLKESRHTPAGKSFFCKYFENGEFKQITPEYDYEAMPV